MKNYLRISGTSTKTKILTGALVLLVALGTSGCGSSNTTTTQQANSSQTNPGQAGQRQNQRNPALQAANELRRLQNDSQMALSSDQKEKVKPILQDLINTANPTSDYLQKQADAINTLLTDAQKNYLTSSRPNGNNNSNNRNSTGNNPNNGNNGNMNGNPPGGNNPNPNNRPNGAPNNNGNGRAFDAKTIYQQVLDLLK